MIFQQIVQAIKASRFYSDAKDLRIRMEDLCRLLPDYTRDELLCSLIDKDGTLIVDPDFAEFVIPRGFFA